jgi:orotate phosphoribosyltransferase
VVNDVVTTGSSFRALAELITVRSGRLAAAAWFVTRAEVNTQALLGVPSICVVTLPLRAWQPEGCALCRAGTPLSRALDLN